MATDTSEDMQSAPAQAEGVEGDKDMAGDVTGRDVVGRDGQQQPARMTVGQILRNARLEQGGRPIADIAEEIRVRSHQLEALEADDFERLPGLIYAAGFIRSYAQYLGLDAQDLVERFKRTARTEDLEAQLAFPEPLDDPRIPRRSLVAIGCAMALAVYGTWYGFNAGDNPGFEDVPTVESRIAGFGGVAPAQEGAQPSGAAVSPATLPDAPDVLAAKKPKVQEAEKASSAEAALTPIVVTTAHPVLRPPVEPARLDQPGTEQSDPEQVLTNSDPVVAANADDERITLRARQDTWLRIEGPGSDPVMDTVLKAGDTYDAPAGRGLYLMTSNAGAIDVVVNGRSVGALGPRGAIRQHVALDATLYRADQRTDLSAVVVPAVRHQ